MVRVLKIESVSKVGSCKFPESFLGFSLRFQCAQLAVTQKLSQTQTKSAKMKAVPCLESVRFGQDVRKAFKTHLGEVATPRQALEQRWIQGRGVRESFHGNLYMQVHYLLSSEISLVIQERECEMFGATKNMQTNLKRGSIDDKLLKGSKGRIIIAISF